MTTRLTRDMRYEICDLVIGDRFERARTKLQKKRAALAYACYRKVYSKAVRDRMSALPDGWLSEDCSMDVKFGTYYETIYFNGQSSRYSRENVPERVCKRFPQKDRSGASVALPGSDPLSERFLSIRDEDRALIDEEKRLRIEALSVLESVTTIKRLVDVWPEVEPFLKQIAPTPKAQVPAPIVADLNKKLGLPAPVPMAAE